MNVPEKKLCLQFQEFLIRLKKYLLHMALSNFRTKMSCTLSKYVSCDPQNAFKVCMICVEKIAGSILWNFARAGAKKNFAEV